MMRKKLLVAAVAGMAAVAFSGTALAVGADDPTPAPAGATQVTPEDNPGRVGDDNPTPGDGPTAVPTTPATATAITAQEAARIALARAGAGTVSKVELEVEHGRTVWSVRIVYRGQEARVDVDAKTGAIVRLRPATSGGGTRSGSGGTKSGGTKSGGTASGSGRDGADDPADHDANDDHGGDRNRGGSDDPAGHDANDDHGGDKGGDDHGGHGGHGNDD